MTFPDTEGAVRAYLRGHPEVCAVFENRGFFAIPDKPTWPLYTIAEQASLEDLSNAPVAQDLLRIDVWGPFHVANGVEVANRPDKATARRGRDAIRTAIFDLHATSCDVTLDTGTVRLAGAVLQSSTWLPDPADGRPRYSIVAQFTALTLEPT